MRILPAGHIEEMSGAHGDLVYVQRKNGTVFARRRPCNRHRRQTEEQVQTRSFTARASANWGTLTAAARQGWDDYAQHNMLVDREGRAVTPNAVAMYVRANMTRQILGLPLLSAPPVKSRPINILGLEAVPSSAPRTVGLRVDYSFPADADLSDLVLLVRMAPPPLTEARKFMPADFRYICKLTPDSAQPLPENGGDVFFSPVQFDVPPGQRYKIEARVARISDGMVSLPMEKEFRAGTP